MPADFYQWIAPAGILFISLIVGLWLRAFVIPRLLRMTAQTRWEADDLIVGAIRGPIVLWGLMAGAYIALECSYLPKDSVQVAGRVLTALWVFSAAWVCANSVCELITHYASGWRMGLPMTSLTQNLAKVVIWVLGLLIILDSIGVKIGSLLAALGIGSLAVALGLQDTLANLFAGVYVSLSRNIEVGDYVKLEGGNEGYVADIGWRATKIRTLPNTIIIVPNAKLAQSTITNYYLPDKELAVLVEVGVDYHSDLAQVERVTSGVGKEVMQTVPGGVPSFEPFIRYHTFGDFSIQFTVILRAKEFVDQYLIKHEFIKRLQVRYANEGITIPFPTRIVQMVSGEGGA